MPLPRDSSGDAGAAPSLASYHAPLAEPLLVKPRRSTDWLGFWRGGPTSSSAGGVAVDWGSLRSACREWVRHPMNVALLLWLLCVGASGRMLVLLLLGLLDGAFPAPAARTHCQYALCWLYWCFTERTRPELAVVVVEPEWAGGMFDFGGGGGEAAAGCCLSLSCTFCVFGWNAERLGFGNACVHATTFVLLCFAPLWVFGVTALRVHDAAIGDVVGGAGVLLCAGGLLYGGYWRIQMRRKFGLPGSAACCGSKSATDYARWLFCWPCALAQEVRTANLYHIDGDSFFHRKDAAVSDHEPLLPSRNRADPTIATSTIAIAASEHDGSDEHSVVVVRDEMVPPQVVQVVVVRDTCEECNPVHAQGKIESPVATSAIDAEEEEGSYLLASNREESQDQRLSGGRWTVGKLKRMINVVTMVSLLFLLYTRRFIP